MEVFQRRVVILIGDDPLLPVLGHTGDRQIASRLPREVVEIALIIRVQDPPRDALERTHGGNRPLGYGIEQKLGEIGTRIFRENSHRAACEVLRDHSGSVAAAAVAPVKLAAVGAEFDGPGRHRVLCADPAEEGPSAITAALQILDIAVFSVTNGEAHAKTADR